MVFLERVLNNRTEINSGKDNFTGLKTGEINLAEKFLVKCLGTDYRRQVSIAEVLFLIISAGQGFHVDRNPSAGSTRVRGTVNSDCFSLLSGLLICK